MTDYMDARRWQARAERAEADNAALREKLATQFEVGLKLQERAETTEMASKGLMRHRDELIADNAVLRETLALIEMETRDGSVWGLRDVNEAARIVLEKP